MKKDEKFDIPPPLENPNTGLKISFSKQIETINDKLYQIIYTIISWYIVSDLWFYFIHKSFHYFPSLYWLHSLHHKMKPCLFSFNCSFIEHLVCNVGSWCISAILIPTPVWFLYTTVIVSTAFSMLSHSGLCCQRNHLLHHDFPKYNFGINYIADRILGTWNDGQNNDNKTK